LFSVELPHGCLGFRPGLRAFFDPGLCSGLGLREIAHLYGQVGNDSLEPLKIAALYGIQKFFPQALEKLVYREQNLLGKLF